MSVRKWLFALALAGLATASAALAASQLARPAAPEATRVEKLTPDQEKARQEAVELGKQMRIAYLELRLAQEKGAPEKDIAAKEKALTDLRGRMRELWAKDPDLRREVRLRGHGRGRGLRGGGGLRHRGGMGLGPGGGRMGRQHRRGMGGDGLEMGPGRGMRGIGGRAGAGGGDRMRLRQRDRLRDPNLYPEVQSAPETQPEEPNQDTQPPQ